MLYLKILLAYTYAYKVLVGIILGIIQGISEWLPISSKTQLLIASNILLNFNFSQAYTLGLFLEGGTFLAALIYFRKEVAKALLAIVGKGGSDGWLLLRYLIVVTIVTTIIAIPIYLFVVSSFTGPVIGVPMIALGILLIVDGLLIKIARIKFTKTKVLKELNIKDLILIGIAQGISALPGISRSGITTSTMLFLKTDPKEAFRLSFFALLPASIGATLVTVLFSSPQVGVILSTLTIPVILLGVAISIVISLFLIRMLITFAGHSRITNLVFILGVIAIFSGIISLATGFG